AAPILEQCKHVFPVQCLCSYPRTAAFIRRCPHSCATILNLKFAVIRRCRARTTRKSLPLSHSPRLAPHHALPRPRTLSPAYCVARAHTRTIVSTRSSLVAPDIAGTALPLPPPPKTQKNILSRKTDAFILCNKYVN